MARMGVIAPVELVNLLSWSCTTEGRQQSKSNKSPQQQLSLAQPLAVEPGTTTRLILRGWELDAVTLVKVSSNGSIGLPKEKTSMPCGVLCDAVGQKLAGNEIG